MQQKFCTKRKAIRNGRKLFLFSYCELLRITEKLWWIIQIKKNKIEKLCLHWITMLSADLRYLVVDGRFKMSFDVQNYFAYTRAKGYDCDARIAENKLRAVELHFYACRLPQFFFNSIQCVSLLLDVLVCICIKNHVAFSFNDSDSVNHLFHLHSVCMCVCSSGWKTLKNT